MHLMDPDFFSTRRRLDLQESVVADGKVKLGDLIVLRVIRIKIILSVKFAVLVDLAVGRQTQGKGVFHHLFIQYGKRPGKASAYRAGMGIGSSPELSRAAAENLGFCRKFYMDFQSDDLNCSPTGRFWLSRVQGMLMAGRPARFTATV